MSGQLVQRGPNLYIKDGEDYLLMHPNSSWMAVINQIFEFEYKMVGTTLYAELIKQLT